MNNVKTVEKRVELNKAQIIDRMIVGVNKRKTTDGRNYLVQSHNVTLSK